MTGLLIRRKVRPSWDIPCPLGGDVDYLLGAHAPRLFSATYLDG